MEKLIPQPIKLEANQPRDRFYRGGSRISRFRGHGETSDRVPEDWIGSVTTVRGESPVGLTTLPSGETLHAAIAANSEWWLGANHVAKFGADTKLLVKLLDAGQRLPVHAHPSDTFARKHLGAAHGKAEAWYILTPGVVFLGLIRNLSPEELSTMVEGQNIDGLLDSMHRLQVEPGDRVYVPPGVLHAIGEGVFLAEVQEPEDLSILLEWTGFHVDGPGTGHLGLGFPLALDAVESNARTVQEIAALITPAGSEQSGLVKEAEKYFRLDRCVVGGHTALDSGFAILIVIDGHISLTGEWGTTELPTGTSWLLPAAVHDRSFDGLGTVLVARPPLDE